MSSAGVPDIADVQHELMQKKKIYSHVKLSALPDGGARLKKQINELESLLLELSIDKKETPQSSSEQAAEKVKTDSSNNSGDNGDRASSKSSAAEGVVDQSVKAKVLDMPSFSDLNKNNSAPFESALPKTPSFTKYRSEADDRKKGTKLTEAQPLPSHIPGTGSGNHCRIGTVASDQTCLRSAKKDAALNIHSSLQTCPSVDEEAIDPPELETPLMRHQKRALAWLSWRESQKPSGGIFADDMGLGKTLTMIALILKNIGNNMPEKTLPESGRLPGGTLVSCPASLVHQWNGEIERHCKKEALNVLVYHGSNRERDPKKICKYDVVLASYDLIRNEGQATRTKQKPSPLFSIAWHRLILDEAHVIKNHKSLTAQWIFELDSVSRWAVTGTPIHNDLVDMYSLLKFLRCSPFDDRKVWKKLITDFSEHSMARRDALIKSILYRRCKDQCDEQGNLLVNLPPKHTYLHKVVLSDTEMELYKELYTNSRKKIHNYEKQAGDRNSSKQERSSVTVLVLLLRLQQCCNHPHLLGTAVVDETAENSILDIMDDFASLNISNRKQDNTNASQGSDHALDLTFDKSFSRFPETKPSSKITRLLKKLGSIPSKDKSVIVSQWVSMLDIVACHLNMAGIEYHTIKGGMKPEARSAVIKDFNFNPKGPPVLLLSLKAGGVGLNLIGGNHIFLLDLHWNPALEAQVCDRVHRVGQNKEVLIHKFVCQDTVEEKVVNLQADKKLLASHVLKGAKNVKDHLTYEEIREFFDL